MRDNDCCVEFVQPHHGARSPLAFMIDLHSHTTASDGTYSPQELVDEAVRIGLEILGITDHDTLAGYDEAVPCAAAAQLPLVCGVELSTKYHRRSVHLLGYFIRQGPQPEFRKWLEGHQASRRDRNRRLVHSLESHGVEITLDEVQAIGGSMAGRPHFARILVQKGYVRNTQEAFDRYLADTAQAYVDRHEPQLAEAIDVITRTGGLPVLAHPVRLAHDNNVITRLLDEMVEMGLAGVETYYSDHDPETTAMYLQLATQRNLAITGGSDFHGGTKPGILLGFGKNHNLNISRSVFEALEQH